MKDKERLGKAKGDEKDDHAMHDSELDPEPSGGVWEGIAIKYVSGMIKNV